MKLNQDLIRQKIGNIQNCLNSIKNYTNNLDSSSLADFKTQDAVIINLERAIQACVDIATHIISAKKLASPSSMKEAFLILSKNNIISSELSQKLIKMVGFRNIAVHAYDSLEVSILESILNNHLQDFENFYIEILKNT